MHFVKAYAVLAAGEVHNSSSSSSSSSSSTTTTIGDQARPSPLSDHASSSDVAVVLRLKLHLREPGRSSPSRGEVESSIVLWHALTALQACKDFQELLKVNT
jgi:hypothetical protein